MGIPSGAKFKIETSPSTDRGYDATAGGSIAIQLEASPALDVNTCVYAIPAKTKNAPTLTGGVAVPPTAIVSIATPVTSPTGKAYAFVLRCQTDGGAAVRIDGKPDFTVNTFERIVVVRNAAGLRSVIVGERLEYDPAYGWTAMLNEMVDVINSLAGGGGLTFGGAPPDIAAASAAGVATTPSRSDHTHGHGNQTANSSAHALADASHSGFLSNTFQQLLAGATSNATPNTLPLRGAGADCAYGAVTAETLITLAGNTGSTFGASRADTPTVVPSTGTVTLNGKDGSNHQEVTITQNTLFGVPAQFGPGSDLHLFVIQGGLGGFTATFTVASSNGFAFETPLSGTLLGTLPGDVDHFHFVKRSNPIQHWACDYHGVYTPP